MRHLLALAIAFSFIGGHAALAQEEQVPAAGVMAPPGISEEEMQSDNDPCEAKITEAENKMSDKMQSGALGDDTIDKINELLDRADSECTDGDMTAAEASLNQALSLAK
ncbi:hypothetical protein V6C03_13685 [Methyloligella sp. 2.7D]|uniref:hypothetical protein n=1 Tax=unclassified Methyloligella TaxID=2625955 RepID=UPI00157BDD96|nr:hypothetical protein [Methyloligella sp. GL2]QKP77185.1 hypothetical protein HT051_06780 [Methyloligella sp. GL2]